MTKLLRLTLLTFSICLTNLYAGLISGYTETTLQTNSTDPQLVNPWGISFSPSSPFWVSDNGTGVATLYNSAGVKQGLVVSMPAGSLDVTGQVNNTTSSFKGDSFLFATENGTITGWRSALGTTAEALFTTPGAEYKGLGISDDKSTIFAANFATGNIDIYNSSGLVSSVSDTDVPAGYAPFNVENIAGVIFVTFALRGPTGDDVAGAGHGYVAILNPGTNTFTTLVSQGALNSPWGLAKAPASFGGAGGDLLVGNFGDGTINAFNPNTGVLVGTLANSGGALSNDGLWGLTFGNGGAGGSVNSLYITAGPNDEMGGLFAQISAVPEPSSILLLGAGAFLILVGAISRSRSRRSTDV